MVSEKNFSETSIESLNNNTIKYNIQIENSNLNNESKKNRWYQPLKVNRVNTVLESYKPPSKYDRVPAMSKGSRRLMGYHLNAVLPESKFFIVQCFN